MRCFAEFVLLGMTDGFNADLKIETPPYRQEDRAALYSLRRVRRGQLLFWDMSIDLNSGGRDAGPIDTHPKVIVAIRNTQRLG